MAKILVINFLDDLRSFCNQDTKNYLVRTAYDFFPITDIFRSSLL